MSIVTRFYFKVFLFFGLGFAMVMMVMDFITGDEPTLFQFVFLLVFYGGFMTLALVPNQINKLKKLGVTEFTPEILSVTQKRRIISPLSQEELISRIESTDHFRKMKMRVKDHEICLTSKFTVNLWGEIIKIHIQPLEDGLNEINIISHPRQKFTLLDSGANYKHVSVIENIVTQDFTGVS